MSYDRRSSFSLISPVFPWKGGIAHHANEFICGILKTSTNLVSVISFSKLYPSFLYPGKTQKEPASTLSPINIQPKYILNPINPITWWNTAKTIISDSPEFLVIKYWHPFFIPCFGVIIRLVQKKGIKVIIIAENLVSHERYFGDVILLKFLFKNIHKIIVFSLIVKEQCAKMFPKINSELIPFPVYDQFGPKISQSEARKKLELLPNKRIILFFGFIRYYKGLDLLLQVLPDLVRSDPNIYLLIVGECFGSFQLYQDIIDKNNLSDRVELRLKYIPNSLIPFYLGSCDLLVAPYRHITNSGIESLGKVYAPRLLVTIGKSGIELKTLIEKTLSAPVAKNDDLTNWQQHINSFMDTLC